MSGRGAENADNLKEDREAFLPPSVHHDFFITRDQIPHRLWRIFSQRSIEMLHGCCLTLCYCRCEVSYIDCCVTRSRSIANVAVGTFCDVSQVGCLLTYLLVVTVNLCHSRHWHSFLAYSLSERNCCIIPMLVSHLFLADASTDSLSYLLVCFRLTVSRELISSTRGFVSWRDQVPDPGC